MPKCYETGFASPGQKRIHDGLVDHRNRFEAHADKRFHEVTLVHKRTTMELEGGVRLLGLDSHGEFIAFKYIKIHQAGALPIDLRAFRFPASKVEARCQRREGSAIDKVIAKFHVSNESGDVVGSINIPPEQIDALLKQWSGPAERSQARISVPVMKPRPMSRQAILRGCL